MDDRDYYRSLPVRDLIERGRDSNHELSIALADELRNTLYELEIGSRKELADMQGYLNDVEDKLEDARFERDELRGKIETLEERIRGLHRELAERN